MEQIFYVGTKEIPEWLQKQIKLGRVKFNYDEYNKFENVVVHAVTNIYVLTEGDAIILTNSGLGVLPKPVNKKEVPVENMVYDEEENF